MVVVNVVETIFSNSQVQITPPHLQLVIIEDEHSFTVVCVLEQATSMPPSLISAGGIEHSPPMIATIYNK